MPVSQKKSMQPENVKRLQRLPGSSSPPSSGPDLTFGGLPMPKLEATYEPMIVKEARYIAITMMKVSVLELVHMPHLVYLEGCSWLVMIRYKPVTPTGHARDYSLPVFTINTSYLH